MKVILPDNLTRAQEKARNAEINRQIVERSKQYEIDLEAMMLWAVHKHLGYGKKRLLDFRNTFIAEAKRLQEYYLMDGEAGFIARIKLKEIGIDVEKLIEEDKLNG